MKASSLKLSFGLGLGMLLILTTGLLYGQSAQSTLTGRVVDSSGAAIPDAAVEITNTETNQTSRAVTDGEGVFAIDERGHRFFAGIGDGASVAVFRECLDEVAWFDDGDSVGDA